MTRQPCTRTSQAKRHPSTGFVLLALLGSSLVGWLLAAPQGNDLSMFLPLGWVALGGYLVLRTQWSR